MPSESKKLTLILDLDETLVNSTEDSKHKKITVSVRPYCFKFLERMSKLYELHVVTLSKSYYAHKVVKHLDPERRLIDRVLTRSELEVFSKTENIHKLYPEGLDQTVILDDRLDVWDYKENVIQVKKYQFFKKGRKHEEDDVLKHMERVLTDVHRIFHDYLDENGYRLDMWNVMVDYRMNILSGVYVIVLGDASEKREIAQRVTYFGAEDNEEVAGMPMVSVKWVEAVEARWKMPDFEEFRVEKPVKGETEKCGPRVKLEMPWGNFPLLK
ncbi:hypothetical protein QR680_007856 [Steinernema hermaphroditum]|uniref:protein-serine/threonine phosphatase n=1 Tax=Steinernema hermaphroditum TaxID=289476 RepID=A0AA39IEG4_9BILA|nr:hypothetical protein QR680_007856 [Steinernema hermaphroditum]